MKINSPKVSNCEVKSLSLSIAESEFCDALYNENIDREVKIFSTTFDGCIFENIDFCMDV